MSPERQLCCDVSWFALRNGSMVAVCVCVCVCVTTNSMEGSSCWDADNRTLVKKFSYFMWPEGSLQCSQESATGLCTAARTLTLSFYTFILILSFHLQLDLRFFLAKIGYAFLYVLHVLPASFSEVLVSYHSTTRRYNSDLNTRGFHARIEQVIIILYISVLTFVDRRREDKRFWIEW